MTDGVIPQMASLWKISQTGRYSRMGQARQGQSIHSPAATKAELAALPAGPRDITGIGVDILNHFLGSRFSLSPPSLSIVLKFGTLGFV